MTNSFRTTCRPTKFYANRPSAIENITKNIRVVFVTLDRQSNLRTVAVLGFFGGRGSGVAIIAAGGHGPILPQ